MDKRKRRLLCMLEGSGRKSRWISGAPPLSFKAFAAGTLENYRIYGNTVGGESVGDRTGNLFNENTLISPIGSLSWYFDNHYLMSNSSSGDGRTWAYDKSQFKFLLSPGTYCLSFDIPIIETTLIFSFFMCDDNNTEILFDDLKNRASYSKSFTINNNTNIGIVLKVPSNIKIRIMLNSGSTPLPYEPYGYKVPVTVSNGTDTLTTPIYLPEQIRKVGDDAEYIDFAEQKMHRIGADDVDVTLPALPTLPGTNVLSVGTEVQPSKIEVKGKIKAI